MISITLNLNRPIISHHIETVVSLEAVNWFISYLDRNIGLIEAVNQCT